MQMFVKLTQPNGRAVTVCPLHVAAVREAETGAELLIGRVGLPVMESAEEVLEMLAILMGRPPVPGDEADAELDDVIAQAAARAAAEPAAPAEAAPKIRKRAKNA